MRCNSQPATERSRALLFLSSCEKTRLVLCVRYSFYCRYLLPSLGERSFFPRIVRWRTRWSAWQLGPAESHSAGTPVSHGKPHYIREDATIEGYLTIMTPSLVRRWRKTRHARRIPCKNLAGNTGLRIALSRHEFIIPFAIVIAYAIGRMKRRTSDKKRCRPMLTRGFHVLSIP